MSFILGLAFGSMLASGPNGAAVSQMLGSIPLRCLYAFEISESDYRDCRQVSLSVELHGNGQVGCDSARRNSRSDPICSRDRHLNWEIGALRKLMEEAKKQQQPQK